MNKTVLTLLSALLVVFLSSPRAGAAPQNGSVSAGSATIIHPSSSTTVVNQATGQIIIDWNSFSIGAGETVKFLQPSALAVALNRVTGLDPSVILGSLQANGRVFLINPNGILFGQGSQVDVGSFVASTLDVRDSDFLNGNLKLSQTCGKPGSFVVNQGKIHAADGGSVVLIAPLISNEGTIVANLGHVNLAATNKVQLNIDGHGLIDVIIPLQAPTTQEVVLTQDAYSAVLQSLFRQANPVLTADGKVILVAGSGVLSDTGAIQANGAANHAAGSVTLNATAGLSMPGGATIQASGAGPNSCGGSVQLLSGGRIDFSGCISTRGGQSGHGGTVEVSGQGGNFTGSVDTSAPGGKHGTFLIDPVNLSIVGGCGGNAGCNTLLTGSGKLGFCCGASQATIGANTISNLSATTNVTLQATHSITLQCLKTTGGASNLLTLKGGSLIMETKTGNITFANPCDSIVATGSGGVFIGAGVDLLNGGKALGTGASATLGNITTQKGTIFLSADGSLAAQSVTTGCGGKIVVQSLTAGSVTVAQATAHGSGGSICLQSSVGNISVHQAIADGACGTVTVQALKSGNICAGQVTATGSGCLGVKIFSAKGCIAVTTRACSTRAVCVSSLCGKVSVNQATVTGCGAKLNVATQAGSVKVCGACANGNDSTVTIDSGNGCVSVTRASANGVAGKVTIFSAKGGTGNVCVTQATANGCGGQVQISACKGTVGANQICANGSGGRISVQGDAGGTASLQIGQVSANGSGGNVNIATCKGNVTVAGACANSQGSINIDARTGCVSVTRACATGGALSIFTARNGNVSVGQASAGTKLLISACSGNVLVGQASAGSGCLTVATTTGSINVCHATANSITVGAGSGCVTVHQACGTGCKPRIDIFTAGQGNISVCQASTNGDNGLLLVTTKTGNISVQQACSNGRCGALAVASTTAGNICVKQANANGEGGLILIGAVPASAPAAGFAASNITVDEAHADGTGGGVIVATSGAGNVTIGTVTANDIVVVVSGAQEGSIFAGSSSGFNVRSCGNALLAAPGGLVGGLSASGQNLPVNVCVAAGGKVFVAAQDQVTDLSINLTGQLSGVTNNPSGIQFNEKSLQQLVGTANFLGIFNGIVDSPPTVPPGFILFNELVVNPPSFLSESQFLSDTPGYFTQLLLTANGQKLVAPSLVESIDDREETGLPAPRK